MLWPPMYCAACGGPSPQIIGAAPSRTRSVRRRLPTSQADPTSPAQISRNNGANAQFVSGTARPSDRYKSSRPCVLPVAAVLLGLGIARSRRQEKPPPHLAHRGNELVAYVCYKFVAGHSHERIITHKSPNTCRIASHLSATEGDHEAHNQTAFQFTISRSKNASAA
jgi:hypothetical protein